MTELQRPIIGIYWLTLMPKERTALENLARSYQLAKTRLDDMRFNFLNELLLVCQVNFDEYTDANAPKPIRKALVTAWQSIVEILQTDHTYKNIIFQRPPKNNLLN